MTEDEARRSADTADRVAHMWGERTDEFHVRSLRFDGPDDPTLYGLAKTFGGAVVEWAPAAALVAGFTGERRERWHHADMVRKVAP